MGIRTPFGMIGAVWKVNDGEAHGQLTCGSG